ncbi:MAG: mechanosensitive ion channel family protein [Acidimicrobiales bacterium]|jgi:small conductance mechanosensitive channel|nr:mechanosensitive ion channel family protein [Acidimicrobiales bacterium]MDP6298114.1 mechanosensitive ion channel family protein [Acidimicrobiales bacterium]HJM29364.1 mechanosensitive ion channel family protein [Acidimicrobiales bacterium]HJM96844.1 mechanosensitive ion channel family protein [Acidimicrobiales bacterium]
MIRELLAYQSGNNDLNDACGNDPGQICEWVFDASGNKTLSSIIGWAVDKPLTIIIVLLVGFIGSRLMRKTITHFGERLTDERQSRALAQLQKIKGKVKAGKVVRDEQSELRTKARTETLTSVLSSITNLAIWTVVALMALGEIGVNLGPLIAGAGIVGVAVGFGAQSIVKDFLSGMFMLVEDQYGVGDSVDVGIASGTVERMTLRTTILRDTNGSVWYIPNGEIARVGNRSQVWSRAVLDIDVAYDTDLRHAQDVMKRVAVGLWEDEEFVEGDIIEEPKVVGVQNLGIDGITLRLVAKTDPSEQWAVARELRIRIKEAFDVEGIEMPFPQRTVWINQEK